MFIICVYLSDNVESGSVKGDGGSLKLIHLTLIHLPYSC